ncbi:hypothetical protein F5Y05DRAFT_383659 [Hypoxylon sp. FL0543]|nr:hypothetical protein F5Y05DRAFT_383659 [Hypoxylon sp. FL0543]
MSPFDQWTTGLEVVHKHRDRIEGKRIAITGPTLGSIGGEVVLALAEANPAQLFILARSDTKADAVIAEFKQRQTRGSTEVHFVPCNLADLDSVRRAAAQIRIQALDGKLDVLFNNAGVHLIYPYRTTAQGFEYHFGVNHYSHFLLTAELWPLLRKAGEEAAVVTTSSTGCQMTPMLWDEISVVPHWSDGESYQPWFGYSISKLANSLFSVGLAARSAAAGIPIKTFAVQPGQPKTRLWDGVKDEGPTSVMEAFRLGKDGPLANYDMASDEKTVEQASSTLLAAAFDPSLKHISGRFLRNCAEYPVAAFALDKDDAHRLWALSEAAVGQKFDM